MELFKHQRDFLKLSPNKSALVWSCGTGKTRTAVEWSQLDTLIICPKGLATNWERECLKWGKSNVVIVTKENFRKAWKYLRGYSSIIVDEVHNGFLTPHFKSQMSKALRDYIKKHKIERVLLLSATVYTSSPWNIYNLAYYLGYKLDWQKFQHEYFDMVWMGPRQIPVPKKGVEEKLAKLVKSIASVVDIHDCMDVPLQQHLDPEYFSLTKTQKDAIKKNYDPLPIVRYTKQHEIENGVLLGNEFLEDGMFKCDKNDRILALCEENKKVAIVCRYNAQIDVLKHVLKDHNPFVISGKIENRDEVCRAAEAADRAVVIIQADCGVGFELPSFELCIYASMSYSYTSWEQMNGRFLRMNKPSRTTFVYLLTEGDSVDQGVYDAVKRKEDFKIELFKK